MTVTSGVRGEDAVDVNARLTISFEGSFTSEITFDVPSFDVPSGSDDTEPIMARAAPFDLHCYTTGRFLRKVGAYEGILLRDLITQAGLSKDPAIFKKTVFIAQAHDGYAVTFSWHELFNTAVGDQVLVAYRCDGASLNDEAGAPILFSAADIVPAPRHMKRLRRIVARVITV